MGCKDLDRPTGHVLMEQLLRLRSLTVEVNDDAIDSLERFREDRFIFGLWILTKASRRTRSQWALPFART